MFHPLRSWRARTEARRAAAVARATYFSLDRHADRLHRELATTADHDRRARLLLQLASAARQMSYAELAGWGPCPNPDEGGRDESTSTAYEAVLYQLLHHAENAIACPQLARRVPPSVFEVPGLDGVAAQILDAAIAAGRVDQAVLDALYPAVLPVVGRQAAELVRRLPVPGGRSDSEVLR